MKVVADTNLSMDSPPGQIIFDPDIQNGGTPTAPKGQLKVLLQIEYL